MAIPTLLWLSLSAALVDFFSYLPLLLKLLLRSFTQRLHQQVISDIPGNPHAFDSGIISLFRTLPEPNNLNIVLSNLPVDEPLLVRGALPTSRCSSLSLYGQGSSEPPSTVDLRQNKDKDVFEVLVFGSSSQAAAFASDPRPRIQGSTWRKGMIAMRNYLVPAGSRVVTPEIIRVRDGSIVRPRQVIYSGPSNLELLGSCRLWGILRVAAANAIMIPSLYLLGFSLEQIILSLAAGLAIFYFIFYWSLFRIGGNQLRKHVEGLTKGTKNQFLWSSIEAGADASQPSSLHNYAMMMYDLRGGKDLLIEGRVHYSEMKYWSFIPYDKHGLPKTQFFNDQNSKNFSNDPETFEYRIRVTNSSTISFDSQREKPHDVFYVNGEETAYIMYRIVHPTDPKKTFPAPKVSVIDRSEPQAKKMN